MSSFKFIDLFSGIGAFHLALQSLGGECVFASEIDPYAIETYKENFNIDSNNDICKVKAEDIPEHDVLCGGFPCQAFSNAGHKKGFADTRGTLFFEIERILEHHKTKYIILENVKHLIKHDNGNTWSVIKQRLTDLGYILTEEPIIMSPHHIGVPQTRERIFILGVHKDALNEEIPFLNISVPDKKHIPETSIYSVLDPEIDDNKYKISEYEEHVFTAWNEFRQHFDSLTTTIWVDEFGKDYEYENVGFPKWKVDYIRKNREIYNNNKEFIDAWMEKYNVKDFKLRDKKFEWQAGSSYNSMWDVLIQLRQSGIRCKKPTMAPTLVAMVQTPIVGIYKTKITPREAARLQSFPDTYILNKNEMKAYKQLGNSANVEVIKYLAKQLLEKY